MLGLFQSRLFLKTLEEFQTEYKKFNAVTSKEFYIQLLIDMEKAFAVSNIEVVEKLSCLIDRVTDVENPETLRDFQSDASNPIRHTNLVILACKHNKIKMLKYLFVVNSKILKQLSVNIGKSPILPHDEDEMTHNCFYYAIRSSNVELLDLLVSQWPDNYFSEDLTGLDTIISKSYQELMLKNILISEDMKYFVEKKLVGLRFFSPFPEHSKNVNGSALKNIKYRIELTLDIINCLIKEFITTKRINEIFLFILKFIAQSIHTLKQQLRSTYSSLPWEEIEFCIVSFVSSCSKLQEINLFYCATLNKAKILNYLKVFAEALEKEKTALKDIDKMRILPSQKREEVKAGIIAKQPQFKELYKDYQQIRDIYTLEKINDYLKLASLADPKERKGQLIITRVLQITGEHFKNTLESPKLCPEKYELLLLSLQDNTREIFIDLRNSLSHVYSLGKRTEIEESADVRFYNGVQNDIKKINRVINDILYKEKTKTVQILLKKIIAIENINELREFIEIFNYVKLNTHSLENIELYEYEELQTLVRELSGCITDKKRNIKDLFRQMNEIINNIGKKSKEVETNYCSGYATLLSFGKQCTELQFDPSLLGSMKARANLILITMQCKVDSQDFQAIARLTSEILHSVGLNLLDGEKYTKVNKLVYKIMEIAAYGANEIKWIEELREDLKRNSSIPTRKQNKIDLNKEEYKKLLEQKLIELKCLLNPYQNASLCTTDKKVNAVVEMLVLDIMSVLGNLKNLESEHFFLTSNTSLLTGKSLRNHLAHDNFLVDTLLSNPSFAVILNAEKLTEGSILKNNKKIGELVRDNPLKWKEKFGQCINVVINQVEMFQSIEEGNIKNLGKCLENGADLHARSKDLWTTLHFAAKGSNLDVAKLISNKNVSCFAKDIYGRSPLHIAAEHGKEKILEFFVKEAGLRVDDVNNFGKTPLHIAAQKGQKKTVEVLLKLKANVYAQDHSSLTPVHHAIINLHTSSAIILLKMEKNMDDNKSGGGYTPLHSAAESGNLEIVNFLLENKVDVNARNDRNWSPLHASAMYGHLEVAKALLREGADVNTRVVNGCTALYYAVMKGSLEIVHLLLKHGADVNIKATTSLSSPLNLAVESGYEDIIKTLLDSKADISITAHEDMNPLHIAVCGGFLNIVHIFLKEDIEINVKDKKGATPLYYAALRGYKDIVEVLIKEKAQVNIRDNNNCTPLHAAASQGQETIVDYLIQNGADINAQDIKGGTPLHAAAIEGRGSVVNLLVKNKAEIDLNCNDGVTPLHAAALGGHEDVITFLIENKANVNSKTSNGLTPLHAAIINGNREVILLLLKNQADVNATGIEGSTLLHLAIEKGNVEIVQILLKYGANPNAKSIGKTPLMLAVMQNNKKIVKILLENGANVNSENGELLTFAVFNGQKNIVEHLMKYKPCLTKDLNKNTLLHIAVSRGHIAIVKYLLTKGENVNAKNVYDDTPLHSASADGFDKIVEVLLANGASINVRNDEGLMPIHKAAAQGHCPVVKTLLDNKAIINVADYSNRLPLEFAVASGHLQVVKMLLQYKKGDMNAKGNNGVTILHIAAENKYLEMVQFLIQEGCDVNARNNFGSKPIHVAAREGCKDVVEYFINQGESADVPGAAGRTALHYAAMKNQCKMARYLLSKGACVDTKDIQGVTALFIATQNGFKYFIEILLDGGAIYNSRTSFMRFYMVSNTTLFTPTNKLFQAIQERNVLLVEKCIKSGAFVNAKDEKKGTPLHFAAWKGCEEIIRVLLQNNVNPNMVDEKGYSPLHYAAKFSHLNSVKILLSGGAIYNIASNGKTPADFAVDEAVSKLFKLVNDSFKSIECNKSYIINDLNKVKDLDTIKAIMRARNKENKTLIVEAVLGNFSEIEELKQVKQSNISPHLIKASTLFNEGNYQQALPCFKIVFEVRKNILGPDNPGTLDVQALIAWALYSLGALNDAVDVYEKVLHSQKEIFGFSHEQTLQTRSRLALVFHRLGKDEEALKIYQEVYTKQKEILGSDHSNTLESHCHMALVLNELGKWDEALTINRATFKTYKKILGEMDEATLRAENNIALVLTRQEKFVEAMTLYKEVYVKKKAILGIHHPDTLRTLQSMAAIYANQKKYNEALEAYQEVLSMQKNVLGPRHPNTLFSQFNLANVLFSQNNLFRALQVYRDCLYKMQAVLGPFHQNVVDTLKRIELINFVYKSEGKEADFIEDRQNDIFIAVGDGDSKALLRLLKDGFDVNVMDTNGQTPLDYAVINGQIEILNILFEHKVNVTEANYKGYTSLHIASSKGIKEVEVLLQHVSQNKLYNYINAKIPASGNTALHIAAKAGHLEIVKSLLKQGAMYNLKNIEGKTPFQISKDKSVVKLLKLVEESFHSAKNGNVEIILNLKATKPDDFLALTKARNANGNTLSQVALINNQKDAARKLLEVLTIS